MAASAILNFENSLPLQKPSSIVVVFLGWYCRNLFRFIHDSILNKTDKIGVKNCTIEFLSSYKMSIWWGWILVQYCSIFKKKIISSSWQCTRWYLYFIAGLSHAVRLLAGVGSRVWGAAERGRVAEVNPPVPAHRRTHADGTFWSEYDRGDEETSLRHGRLVDGRSVDGEWWRRWRNRASSSASSAAQRRAGRDQDVRYRRTSSTSLEATAVRFRTFQVEQDSADVQVHVFAGC